MQQSSATQSLHLVFGGCGRLLHALTPLHSAFLYLQFLVWCQPTSYFIFNVCRYKKALQGRVKSMQQFSTTPSLHHGFWGLRKIVAFSHSSSQCLLVSIVFGMVSSLHPTYFILEDTRRHCKVGIRACNKVVTCSQQHGSACMPSCIYSF